VGVFVGALVAALVGDNDGGKVGSGVGDPNVLSLQTHGIHSNPFSASQTSHPASLFPPEFAKAIRQQAECAVPSADPQLLLRV